MILKDALVEATMEISQMFGLDMVFQDEFEETHQLKADQVNVLMGLTDGLKGNIIFGFKEDTARQVVSSMMGGMEIKELYFMAQSALGELANMTVGTALMKIQNESTVNLSPPTVVAGGDMFMTLSGTESKKLLFKLNEKSFNMIYSIY
jgi:chemotaxis protein CheX